MQNIYTVTLTIGYDVFILKSFLKNDDAISFIAAEKKRLQDNAELIAAAHTIMRRKNPKTAHHETDPYWDELRKIMGFDDESYPFTSDSQLDIKESTLE